jgi:hypothetical protein
LLAQHRLSVKKMAHPAEYGCADVATPRTGWKVLLPYISSWPLRQIRLFCQGGCLWFIVIPERMRDENGNRAEWIG